MKRGCRLLALSFLAFSFSVAPGCAASVLYPPPLAAASTDSAGYGRGVSRLGYAIQMGAFSEVKNAERFTAMLQAKGIEAFYFRKDNGIYAVRFGDFPSRAKARATAQRLVHAGLISSYYIAPPHEVVFTSPAPLHRGSNNRTPAWEAGKPPELHAPHTGGRETGDRQMGTIAARTAERFVGIPYQWGGNTVVDGMDCSGFVRAVYNLCGVSIPRTSREQFNAGSPVARSDLKEGDLVFFGSSDTAINHVGIYVGNDRFVHAPKRGEEIRISSLDESYFEHRFVGARRYFH